MSPASTPFAHALVAGGLAGTSVDLLFFPIDTIKTRAQAHGGFLAAGGFRGVYRGVGSAVVGSAPGAATFFTTYEVMKTWLPGLLPSLGTDRGQPLLHMVAASLGETAACLVRVPTEVVKQRAQTSVGTSSWATASSVLASEGIKGFYRGFGITVAREIPFTCLQFPLYERLKLLLAKRLERKLYAYEAAGCGSIAGGFAAGLTTPLDVGKTRIMLSGREGGKQYPSGIIGTLRVVVAEEGVRALWSGVGPRILWISAGGAVFLGVYEAVKGALASLERPR